MRYLLAIDQGTSSTRAALYSTELEKIAVSQYPLKQYYPKPGWVEHDPEEIWSKTLQAIKDVVSKANGAEIEACGITNQRETVVIWDKQTGKCLAPAIVWQDRRTQQYCESIAPQTSLIQRKTGLRPDPYFSASKIKWLLENVPKAQELAEKGRLAFGTMDSFIIWRLTNGQSHRTDVTNASRTLLFNIHQQNWDEELLSLFAIPKSMLPEVCASDGCYGDIDASHFGQSIPITGVAGDQQAALVGQHCFREGETKATFGTGGFLLMNTGSRAVLSNHHLLTTIAYRIKGKTVYGLEGSIYHAGTTVKWLCEGLKLIRQPADTETLAASLKSNEGVYLVSSFTGLAAPHWVSRPGALIHGISRETTAAHFARAALEGVAYQTRELLTCMRQDSHLPLSVLRVDGGMAANSWFLQFLASQCQTQVQCPKDIESTVKGAAMLAGLGAGLFSDFDQLERKTPYAAEFHPKGESSQIEQEFKGWQQAVACLS